jgi:hypothetical protein
MRAATRTIMLLAALGTASLAAAVEPATPAPAAAAASPAVVPESPYDVASRLYEQGRQAEALVQLQKLADEGDARAQFVAGLDLIEGVHVKRDNVRGFAYIVLASEDTRWGDLVAPRAREARAVIEPQLSGADLIHADALIAELRARQRP